MCLQMSLTSHSTLSVDIDIGPAFTATASYKGKLVARKIIKKSGYDLTRSMKKEMKLVSIRVSNRGTYSTVTIIHSMAKTVDYSML